MEQFSMKMPRWGKKHRIVSCFVIFYMRHLHYISLNPVLQGISKAERTAEESFNGTLLGSENKRYEYYI